MQNYVVPGCGFFCVNFIFFSLAFFPGISARLIHVWSPTIHLSRLLSRTHRSKPRVEIKDTKTFQLLLSQFSFFFVSFKTKIKKCLRKIIKRDAFSCTRSSNLLFLLRLRHKRTLEERKRRYSLPRELFMMSGLVVAGVEEWSRFFFRREPVNCSPERRLSRTNFWFVSRDGKQNKKSIAERYEDLNRFVMVSFEEKRREAGRSRNDSLESPFKQPKIMTYLSNRKVSFFAAFACARLRSPSRLLLNLRNNKSFVRAKQVLRLESNQLRSLTRPALRNRFTVGFDWVI